MEKVERNREIMALIDANPEMTYRELGKRFGISDRRVHEIAKRGGHARGPCPWSVREIATLKRLYGRKRVREIADELGRTRNEVIGKANRLGLCKSTAHLRRAGDRTDARGSTRHA